MHMMLKHRHMFENSLMSFSTELYISNYFYHLSCIPSSGNDQMITFVHHHMGLFGQGRTYYFLSLDAHRQLEQICEESEGVLPHSGLETNTNTFHF